MKNKSFISWAFTITALLSGFIFLSHGITGNVILSSKSSFSPLPIIGLALITLGIIVGLYSSKR